MTVHIDAITTEVSATPEPATATAAREAMEWEEAVKLEALRARLARDELRTRGEGYDD